MSMYYFLNFCFHLINIYHICRKQTVWHIHVSLKVVCTYCLTISLKKKLSTTIYVSNSINSVEQQWSATVTSTVATAWTNLTSDHVVLPMEEASMLWLRKGRDKHPQAPSWAVLRGIKHLIWKHTLIDEHFLLINKHVCRRSHLCLLHLSTFNTSHRIFDHLIAILHPVFI